MCHQPSRTSFLNNISFSVEDKSPKNNVVQMGFETKTLRIRQALQLNYLTTYLLYPSWCDDVISHATISEKYILAHCENWSQSVKKQ